MGRISYFAPENTWKRVYLVDGFRSDEFFTDGCTKMNIEQLIHQELVQSGYERIVFYDRDNKIYCYDDRSYSMIHSRSARDRDTSMAGMKNTMPAIPGHGLKAGKLGRKSSAAVKAASDAGRVASTDSEWEKGRCSGLRIRKHGSGQLHMGVTDNTVVLQQIDGYMRDAEIRTAVVINNAETFLCDFGDNPVHNFTTRYLDMGSQNHNIVLFLYPDSGVANVYRARGIESNLDREANIIHIPCPNASELRNMLVYYRLRHGLKLSALELEETALALHRAMLLGERPVRIKEIAARLDAFTQSGERLTPDGCYSLLQKEKPKSAAQQLHELIGMHAVKEALSLYGNKYTDHDRRLIFRDQESSRIRPCKSTPKGDQEMIHFMLTGNPGTGKTTVAKLIGQLFYEMGYLESGHCVETDRSGLVGDVIGRTAILTRQKVEEAIGGVLFIDEAYTLKPEADSGRDFGQESIDTLVKCMDQYKGRFILVAAGYQGKMKIFEESNPGLSRRFTCHLHLDDYTDGEMHQLLVFFAGKKNAVFSNEMEEFLPGFCKNWTAGAGKNWGNAGEAENLVNDMMRRYRNDPCATVTADKDGHEAYILEKRHLPERYRVFSSED